jgi:hypothetical protein
MNKRFLGKPHLGRLVIFVLALIRITEWLMATAFQIAACLG